MATYVTGALLEQYERCMKTAALALGPNPRDFTLLNNYAFAAANVGKVHEARNALDRIKTNQLTTAQLAVRYATGGLVAYRLGQHRSGRKGYLRAVQIAQHCDDDRIGALAQMFLAREELRIRSPEAELYRKQAIDAADSIDSVDVRAVAGRLRDYKPEDAAGER